MKNHKLIILKQLFSIRVKYLLIALLSFSIASALWFAYYHYHPGGLVGIVIFGLCIVSGLFAIGFLLSALARDPKRAYDKMMEIIGNIVPFAF